MTKELEAHLKKEAEKWEYLNYEPDADPGTFWRIYAKLPKKDGSYSIESRGCGCCGEEFVFTKPEYMHLLKKAVLSLVKLIDELEAEET